MIVSGIGKESIRVSGKFVELLAPAGSYDSMTAAINAGADAVYMGGTKFGARAYADNPDEETLIKAIDYAHLHGCRVHLTLNTLVKEREIDDIPDFLEPYYEAGVDAVLIQDLGVLSLVHDRFPDLPIHISTQMTVTDSYSADFLKNFGVTRIVPARELSLSEIRELAEKTGLEIETFVHGALCYCYSGQCLFSSLIGGRSGNRGRCAQTCRLPFDVLKDGYCVNDKDCKYVLSMKDLCTLDILPDIIDAGVSSLKIEGRMKSPRYTAGVTSIYRKYLDMYLEKGREGYKVEDIDRKAILTLFDRGGQTDGYLNRHNGRGMIVLKEETPYGKADMDLYNYLDKTYMKPPKKEYIRGNARFEAGKPSRMYVEYTGSAGTAKAAAEGAVVEEAQNAPMTRERIEKQLLKTGDSPFEFEELEVTADDNIFIRVHDLNELRRSALDKLEESVCGLCHREDPAQASAGISGRTQNIVRENASLTKTYPEFTAFVSNMEQFEAILKVMSMKYLCSRGNENDAGFGIYISSETFEPTEWGRLAERCHDEGVRCYLMMPRIFRKTAENFFFSNMDFLKSAGFDAICAASMEEPGFLKENVSDIPMYTDWDMYAMNHMAAETLADMGSVRITVPFELNEHEIRDSGISGEMIVYGRIPVMISAQCIKKTTGRCDRCPEVIYLKDRTGREFPVENVCRFCYNTIYNNCPLSLHGLLSEVKEFSPKAVRLNFTFESGAQCAGIFESFYNEYLTGREAVLPVSDFTRGHFKRGVE